eukprot:TRINITY_DN51300_c0_g1_i1.p2 TRINITY_DN51300_c0_g1~~TRINITY_DN51300_c0_g1_i1.p2  ORF type:complete len:278 (+),score=63.17 TRINITY_DN51300_c0_g1_i1:82-915(+)
MLLLMMRHAQAEHNFKSISLFTAGVLAAAAVFGVGFALIAHFADWGAGAVVGMACAGVVVGSLSVLVPMLRRLWILDPRITQLGEQQVQQLATRLRGRQQPSLVLVSSATRCLQTASAAFEGVPVRMFALDDIREVPPFEPLCVCPADRRRSQEELAALFPRVDFSALEHRVDPIGRSSVAPDLETEARTVRFAETVRRLLAGASVPPFGCAHGGVDPMAKADGGLVSPCCIAVVSHDGFLRQLLSVLGRPRSKHISNCELVEVELTDCALPTSPQS